MASCVALLAAGLEQAIGDGLGIETRVLVRTAAAVRSVVDDNPLAELAASAPNRLQVSFLDGKPDVEALRPVLDEDWGADRAGA